MKSLRVVLFAACCLMIVATVRADDLGGLLIDGQDWELVTKGYAFTEGPAVDLTGNLYFTDAMSSKIHRVNQNGPLTPTSLCDTVGRRCLR